MKILITLEIQTIQYMNGYNVSVWLLIHFKKLYLRFDKYVRTIFKSRQNNTGI